MLLITNAPSVRQACPPLQSLASFWGLLPKKAGTALCRGKGCLCVYHSLQCMRIYMARSFLLQETCLSWLLILFSLFCVFFSFFYLFSNVPDSAGL